MLKCKIELKAILSQNLLINVIFYDYLEQTCKKTLSFFKSTEKESQITVKRRNPITLYGSDLMLKKFRKRSITLIIEITY